MAGARGFCGFGGAVGVAGLKGEICGGCCCGSAGEGAGVVC